MTAVRGDPSDEIIQGALDKANTCRQLGNTQAALDELLFVMHTRKNRTRYGPLLREMMSRILSLSMEDGMMCNRKTAHAIKEAIKSYRDRLKHNVTTLEEAVTAVFTQMLKRISEQFVDGVKKSKEMVEKPSAEDIALWQLSAVPVERAARTHLVDRVVKNAEFLLSTVMNKFAFTFIGRLPMLFLGIIDSILRMATDLLPEKKNDAPYAVLAENSFLNDAPKKLVLLCVRELLLRAHTTGGGYFDHLLFSTLRVDHHGTLTSEAAERQLETYKNLKIARKTFLEEPERTEKLLSTLTVLTDLCLKVELWGDAHRLVHAARTLIGLCSDERRPISAKATAPVYQCMANVFLVTKEPTFHAQCQQWYAIALRRVEVTADEREEHIAKVKDANTMAVIATLCAPEIDEERVGFKRGFDVEFEHRKEIARYLELLSAPSRSVLVNKLRASRLMDTADLVDGRAVALLNLLLGTVAKLPAQVVEHTAQELQALAAGSTSGAAAWATYTKLAVQVAVDRFLERAAATQSKLRLSTLPAPVLRFLEGVDNDLPILLDHEADEVVFQSPLNRRIVETYATVLSAAAALGTSAASAKLAKPTVAVTMDEILDDSDRCVAIYALQRIAKESAAYRQTDAKKREEDLKKEAIQRSIKEEDERKRKLKEEHLAKYEQEVKVLEAREKRKKIMEKLMEKHKGLKLNPTLSHKPHDHFLRDVTEALAAYEREMSDGKSLDIRRADHFERACREREIPKRTRMAEQMQDQMRQDREVRVKNLLEQHRQAYDHKKEAIAKMQKFLPFAGRFMADELRAQAALQPAVSKRDEQEAMLQAEKARLASQAGPVAAAAAPAAAAAAPVPEPAAAASPAEPPAAGGKWQAKARGDRPSMPPPPEEDPMPAPAAAAAPAAAPPAATGAKWQPKSRGTSKPPPTD